MSTSPSPFSYRRRLGRAPSPPTWAWYEQIPLEDDDSETDSVEEDSCSEDDEDYEHRDQQEQEHDQSSVSSGEELESPTALGGVHIRSDGQETKECDVDGDDGEHDDTAESGARSDKMEVEGDEGHDRKDLKGKQRAVDPVPAAQESPRRRERRKKHRQPMSNFRPILTIQRSQGFVWNQVSLLSMFHLHSHRLY
jgi:hypothetical protein